VRYAFAYADDIRQSPMHLIVVVLVEARFETADADDAARARLASGPPSRYIARLMPIGSTMRFSMKVMYGPRRAGVNEENPSRAIDRQRRRAPGA
jgi:hypothetical protein